MKIIVIPDCQVKPNTRIDHLEWAGKYIAEKKPDVIVNIGDFWDMPSLSCYDKGKKDFEGRRYKKDVEAGNAAMDLLLAPIKKESNKRGSKWKPRLVHIQTGYHVSRPTHRAHSMCIFVYGAVTLYRAPFQTLPLTHTLIQALGCSPFARRYWGFLRKTNWHGVF